MALQNMPKARTSQQCLLRWTKTLAPHKRGRWSKEEDAQLIAAIKKYGAPNWSKIQTLVPDRTDVQCRERFVNVLDPTVKKGKFSADEDALLEKAVKVCGVENWSTVAATMAASVPSGQPTRTDSQLRTRYLNIHKELKGRATLRTKLKGKIRKNFEHRCEGACLKQVTTEGSTNRCA